MKDTQEVLTYLITRKVKCIMCVKCVEYCMCVSRCHIVELCQACPSETKVSQAVEGLVMMVWVSYTQQQMHKTLEVE